MQVFSSVLIMDQIIRGSAEVHTAPEHNATLGKAFYLALEIECEEASGTTPTITVKHKSSNSGKGFITMSTLVNAVVVGTPPYRDLKTATGPWGSQGQIGVQFGNADNVCRVRIWATGWSN